MVNIITTLGNYINLFFIIFSAIVSIISIIYKIKSNFTKQISQFIKDAEKETDLSGPEKMDMVISWVKDLIPRLFHVIFSDKVLKQIAKNIYDDMKEYREIYIKNKTGLETSQVIQIVDNVAKTGKSSRR